MYDMTFRIPSRENVDYLEKMGEEYLVNEIFLFSKGLRDIDLINFEICFPEEYFIIKVSEDIEKTNDYCVRVKKENIIQNEMELGTVIVVNNKEPLYWDLWPNPIRGMHGKYVSKGKEFNLDKNSVGRVVSGVIPNCSLP